MRKQAIIAIAMLVIFLCCGCSPNQNDGSPYDISNISNISFVWVDHDGAITVEESLDPNLFSVFWADFLQLSNRTYWNDPVDWIYGSAIKISFHDGSYHLINHYCTLYCYGDDTDDTRQYYGSEEFETLWSQYCRCEYRHD